MDLSACYRPLTAAPYRRGNTYWESAPCAALRPWVRCFWRTGEGAGPSLVIPDTCMDLMLYREPGGWRGAFCALNDRPFTSTGQRAVAFAIRLYPWAGAMFAQESLAGACNGHFDGRQHFPNLMERLLPALASCDSFEDCRAAAEACLLSLGGEGRPPADFLNALAVLVGRQAAPPVRELAKAVCLSPRQLERLFARCAGLSPKVLSSLIRYQRVWRAAVCDPRFEVQEAVYRYGYADQAHLLNAFRRYHSRSLRQALALARQDVAFLQDVSGER